MDKLEPMPWWHVWKPLALLLAVLTCTKAIDLSGNQLPTWVIVLLSVGAIVVGLMAAITLHQYGFAMRFRKPWRPMPLSATPYAWSLARVGDELQSMGFATPATLIDLEVAQLSCYRAQDARTWCVVLVHQSRISLGFASFFERGVNLCTQGKRATLPEATTHVTQSCPKLGPKDMLRRHHKAVNALEHAGFEIRLLSDVEFHDALFRAFRGNSIAFMRRPIVSSAIGLWRMASRRSPHDSPIQHQTAVKELVDDVLGRQALMRFEATI